MKRRRLLQHLREHGCIQVREGRAHTVVANPAKGLQTIVARHREIDAPTARGICKQLDVPPPPER